MRADLGAARLLTLNRLSGFQAPTDFALEQQLILTARAGVTGGLLVPRSTSAVVLLVLASLFDA